ncbi:chaperone protein DnaK 2-like [Rhynchophorus ferrugineus]|uniref:chaperone protein DnaK 2-like n=1 Tax=Rhynchophorus ferrugineus TaxID=354439 RepID=UPI003FCC8D06
MRRLNEKCIVLKEKLSIQDCYDIPLECVDGSDEDFTLDMSRTQYEEIIADLVEKSIVKVKRCIEDLNIPPEDITNVLLIGGVTRTPIIQQKLSRYFGWSKLKTDVNPDEAVALGAAYQAALLTGQCKKIEKITEVAPLSLGVTAPKGLVTEIIEKGTKLPTIQHKMFSTLQNNQSIITWGISEGERKNEAYNKIIETFSCDNLPESIAGLSKKLEYINKQCKYDASTVQRQSNVRRTSVYLNLRNEIKGDKARDAATTSFISSYDEYAMRSKENSRGKPARNCARMNYDMRSRSSYDEYAMRVIEKARAKHTKDCAKMKYYIDTGYQEKVSHDIPVCA